MSLDDDFAVGFPAAPTPPAYESSGDSDFAVADDDDDEDCPPLVVEDDDDFAFGGSVAPTPIAKRRRKRVGRVLQTVGCFCVFLMADHTVPTPDVIMERFAKSPDSEPHYDGREILGIVGVLVLGLTLRRAGTDAPTNDLTVLARDAKRKRRGVGILGVLDYFVEAVVRYDEIFEIRREELEDPFAPMGWSRDLAYISFADGSRMDDFCDRYSCAPPNSFISVSPTHAEVLVKELSAAVKVVAISDRSRRNEVFQCGPPFQDVKKWARQLKLEDRQRVAGGSTAASSKLLELPVGTPDNPQSGRKSAKDSEQLDAVALLRWMRFTRHLHAQEAITEAADDGLDAAIAPGDTLRSQMDAARTRVPKKSSLKEGRVHLDATTMLLRRRWFHELITERPHDVLAFFLYTDGSPVSGTELQGMLLDYISRAREVVTLVLPGIALAYGAYGVLSKAFALLWALYLFIGPWPFGLQFVLDRIRATTTDMGTELALADVPNLVHAFLKHIFGASIAEIAGTVDLSTRLFKRCLRIDGWSHRFGNLMNQGNRAIPIQDALKK